MAGFFRLKAMKQTTIIIIALLSISCVGNGPGGGNESPAIETPVFVTAGQSNMVADVDGIPGPDVPYYFAVGLSGLIGGLDMLNVAVDGASLERWQVGGDLFEARIRPNLDIKPTAIIWWQGTAEARHYNTSHDYAEQFERMITEWRIAFDDPQLPFFMVELHNYYPDEDGVELESWIGVRAAQYAVAAALDAVYVVESTDITDGDIHPHGAYQEIGQRLAISVYNNIYAY